MKQTKIIQFNNGSYQGSFDSSYKKHGFGIFLFDDSTLYVGDWKNDNYHGKGTIYLPYGGYFMGLFKKHQIEEIGCTVTANKIFIANYHHSILSGDSISLTKGVWQKQRYLKGQLIEISQSNKVVNDNFLEQMRQIEQFKIQTHNGLSVSISDMSIQIGEFKQGQLDGIGRKIKDNGDVFDGFFKGGILQNGYIYSRMENKFQQISIILGQNGLETKINSQGQGFPQKLIRGFREQIRQTAKNYMGSSQDKPLFHGEMSDISWSSSMNPIFDYSCLIKLQFGDLIMNEGQILKPELSITRTYDHFEQIQEITQPKPFLESYENEDVFLPINIIQKGSKDIQIRKKKRIFDD